MQSETKERWILLCEQASTEQDSKKMVELIQEINYLLEEKRSRVKKKEVDGRGGQTHLEIGAA